MRFIKENPALSAGIGLPVLLVLLFSLATIIPQWLVAPPQYDVIFVMRNQPCVGEESKVSFEFIKGKIRAKYIYPKNANGSVSCYDSQKLFRFDAKNMTSKEITFEVPAKNEDGAEWKELEIEELKNIKLDNSPVAPDGYEFVNVDNDYRGGISPFAGRSNRTGLVISKSGRKFEILSDSRDRFYHYGNTGFIGWVIPEGEK